MTTWGTHLMASTTLFPLLHPKILAAMKLNTTFRENDTVHFAFLKQGNILLDEVLYLIAWK